MDESKTGMFSRDMSELEGLWEMTHSRSNHGWKKGLEEGGRGGAHWDGVGQGAEMLRILATRHTERRENLG